MKNKKQNIKKRRGRKPLGNITSSQNNKKDNKKKKQSKKNISGDSKKNICRDNKNKIKVKKIRLKRHKSENFENTPHISVLRKRKGRKRLLSTYKKIKFCRCNRTNRRD